MRKSALSQEASPEDWGDFQFIGAGDYALESDRRFLPDPVLALLRRSTLLLGDLSLGAVGRHRTCFNLAGNCRQLLPDFFANGGHVGCGERGFQASHDFSHRRWKGSEFGDSLLDGGIYRAVVGRGRQ